MELQLAHEQLRIYKIANKLVLECYAVTEYFPPTEKYNLVQQIRRAATSILLNISEGASRKTAKERIRYYEVARGSVVEVRTALSLSVQLNFCDEPRTRELSRLITSGFRTLSHMIRTLSKFIR